jgi:hypothetical protein
VPLFATYAFPDDEYAVVEEPLTVEVNPAPLKVEPDIYDPTVA